jgi:hypothetical protein
MVIPVAPAASATVEFQENPLILDLDTRDLDFITEARRGSTFHQGFLPSVLVIAAIALENQRLFGSGQDDFRFGELGIETAFDFHALVDAEFVRTKKDGGS